MLWSRVSSLLYHGFSILVNIKVVAYEAQIQAWHFVRSPCEYFDVLFKEMVHLLALSFIERGSEQKEAGAVLVDWHGHEVFNSFFFSKLADVFKDCQVVNFDPLDLLWGSSIVNGRDVAFLLGSRVSPPADHWRR